MKKVAKIMTGAVATAMLAVGAAAPAEAQYYRNRDRGIDAGDVLTGIAVVGGVAAIASAIGNSNRYDRGYGYNGGYVREGYGYPGYGGYNGYGYNQGYGYNSGYGANAAIQACAYRAERNRGGRVQILDVDQRSARSYRVRGVIQGNDGYYGGGYNRYDRSVGFSCTARDNGRVTDFDTNRYY